MTDDTGRGTPDDENWERTPIPPGLENIDTCARCDAPIDRRGWHYTGIDTADSEMRIHVFCSRACREQWREASD